MSKKVILILVCFLILVSGIGIASAETLIGTLGEAGYNSTNWTMPNTGNQADSITKLYARNIQYSTGTTTLTLFQNGVGTADSGAPSGVAVPFVANLDSVGGEQIGYGTLGYQRVFTTGGVELPGSMWIYFQEYDPGSNTGSHNLFLNYSLSQFRNYTFESIGDSSSPEPDGGLVFAHTGGTTGTKLAAGDYLQLKDVSSTVSYSATKPLGIGIEGVITKTEGVSQAFVFSATGQTLASEYTVSANPLNFSVSAEQIKIGIYTSSGWYNSSVLFSSGITPTPTVTPTTAPTIAPGYVRTYVETIDGTSGYTIHGSNIFLYDVEGSVWSNSSSDSNGEHYIDTLPYHTINAYATYTVFADHYSNAEALGLPTGYYGDFHYKLSMFPPAFDPGEGNVNLYVSTFDADTYDIVREASVQIRLPTGAVQGGNTGQSGTEIFVVPNNTVINIAASKTGYVGSNTVVSSGTGTTASAAVYLRRMTVTTVPTGTIPPGGVTVPPTQDPNDPALHGGDTNPKAQEMMNWIAMHGMDIVQLCFLVTILGLLGIKLGK